MSRWPGITPTERFWSHVDKSGPCWLWKAAKGKDGYGRFRAPCPGRRGKTVLAHRFAHQVSHGQVPAGMVVMHTCDTPLCCNPNHLRVGTQDENMADMVAKGRQVSLRGEKSRWAKLTEAQVRGIRLRHARGETGTAIARDMGLGQSHVSMILTGRSWAHVGLAETP